MARAGCKAAKRTPRALRCRGFVWWPAVALIAVAAVAAALLTQAAANGSLLRWAVARAELATQGQLRIEAPTGSPFDTLQAERVTWRDAGTTVMVEQPRIALSWRSLLQARIVANSVQATRVEIINAANAPAAAPPDTLAAPVRIDIAEMQIQTLVLRTEGRPDATTLRDLRASLRYDRAAWSVDTFSLRTDLEGSPAALRGSVRLQDQPPFAITGQALLETRLLNESVPVDATLSGQLEAIEVRARTRLRDAGLSLRTVFTPFAPHLFSVADLDATTLDLSRFVPGLPPTRLSGTLRTQLATGAASASLGLPPLVGQIVLENALEGPLEATRLPVRRATGALALNGDTLRVRNIALDGAAGRVTGELILPLAPGAAARGFDLRLATDRLDLQRVHSAAVSTALQGTARVRPQGDALVIDADLTDPQRAIALQTQARLQGEQLTIASARVQAQDGIAEFSGTAGVAAPYALALTGTVSRLDPARFADLPAGLLNGPWELSGTLLPTLDLQARVALTDSRWQGQALAGKLSGHYGPGDRISRLDTDLQWGATRVRARGDLGQPTDRMTLTLDTNRLQDLDAYLPGQLSGQLSAQLTLSGALTSPAVSGRLSTRDLRSGDHLRVRVAELTADIGSIDAARQALARTGLIAPSAGPTPAAAAATASSEPMMLKLKVDGLRFDAHSLDALTIDFQGDAERHGIVMQATARARPLDARVRVQGGFEQGAPGRWRGQILEATQTTDPTVRMLAPALLEADLPALRARLAQGAFELDGPSGARLDLDQVEWADAKGLMARGKLSRIPVRWVDGYVAERGVRTQLPDALRLGATFDLSATLDAAGTPSLQGAVSAFRESGDLLIEAPASEGGVELLRAGLKQLDARLQFAGARAAATLQVRGDALGSATAQAEVPLQFAAGDWMPSLKVPLSGRVDVNVPSLGFTRALVGEAWRLSGVLQAQLALSGTLQQPRISGALTGKQLVAVQREFGMRLTDGELDAQVTDNQIDVRTLRFASGKGSVQMTGSLRPDDRSEAVVTLSQMPIPLGAGQRLVLSGESRATLAGGLLSLRGALRADEGVIEISSGDTPEVSSDVVVVRNATQAAARREQSSRRTASRDTASRGARTAAGTGAEAERTDAPVANKGFRVQANLAIDLGDRFRVFGAGVDARLAGQVTLSGRLPDAPRLNGTVSIAQGSYTGFGQNLEIERGKLVFSGPVDNPAIDIVAYRRFLPVEAGVAISGTARFPRLTLVSKPDVPEPDKLSWLVLGMSAESSRGGQAAALQAAAVLLASGDPRAAAAPSLASTVGLDVLSVRTGASGLTSSGSAAASVQDSVVTLGKRVSERLFLSYEQSLRGLQNLLRLQYEISERLSIRGRVGTENAIDLVWTKRYD